jgi:hypothetical protein
LTVDLAGLQLGPVQLVVHDSAFGRAPRGAVERPWIEAKGSQSRLDFPDFVALQRGWVRLRLDKRPEAPSLG